MILDSFWCSFEFFTEIISDKIFGLDQITTKQKFVICNLSICKQKMYKT